MLFAPRKDLNVALSIMRCALQTAVNLFIISMSPIIGLHVPYMYLSRLLQARAFPVLSQTAFANLSHSDLGTLDIGCLVPFSKGVSKR